MKLRTKLTIALLFISLTATLSVGVLAYLATDTRLHAEVDNSLRTAASLVQTANWGGPGRGRHPSEFPSIPELPGIGIQVIAPDGSVQVAPAGPAVPVSADELAVAAGTQPGGRLTYALFLGHQYRVLTVGFQAGDGAVSVNRDLAEVNRVLSALRTQILIAALLVILLSAAAGVPVARQITRRLVKLAAAAGTVAETGRLDVPVETSGTDETASVAKAFAIMLDTLGRSQQAQQRLVQDAGHELRTPLTSLRTNLDVLSLHPELPARDRSGVIEDLRAEALELTNLVNELVELAAGEANRQPPRPLELRSIVERVVRLARRRTGRDITVAADFAEVLGQPGALERAVSNLVDNALKFAPSGPVHISVAGGAVTVFDHGPGLATADVPHVFDRFYRSAVARGLPGSGLGLSIVQGVVLAHGGSVFAANVPGGGAAIGFRLPLTPSSHL